MKDADQGEYTIHLKSGQSLESIPNVVPLRVARASSLLQLKTTVSHHLGDTPSVSTIVLARERCGELEELQHGDVFFLKNEETFFVFSRKTWATHKSVVTEPSKGLDDRVPFALDPERKEPPNLSLEVAFHTDVKPTSRLMFGTESISLCDAQQRTLPETKVGSAGGNNIIIPLLEPHHCTIHFDESNGFLVVPGPDGAVVMLQDEHVPSGGMHMFHGDELVLDRIKLRFVSSEAAAQPEGVCYPPNNHALLAAFRLGKAFSRLQAEQGELYGQVNAMFSKAQAELGHSLDALVMLTLGAGQQDNGCLDAYEKLGWSEAEAQRNPIPFLLLSIHVMDVATKLNPWCLALKQALPWFILDTCQVYHFDIEKLARDLPNPESIGQCYLRSSARQSDYKLNEDSTSIGRDNADIATRQSCMSDSKPAFVKREAGQWLLSPNKTPVSVNGCQLTKPCPLFHGSSIVFNGVVSFQFIEPSRKYLQLNENDGKVLKHIREVGEYCSGLRRLWLSRLGTKEGKEAAAYALSSFNQPWADLLKDVEKAMALLKAITSQPGNERSWSEDFEDVAQRQSLYVCTTSDAVREDVLRKSCQKEFMHKLGCIQHKGTLVEVPQDRPRSVVQEIFTTCRANLLIVEKVGNTNNPLLVVVCAPNDVFSYVPPCTRCRKEPGNSSLSVEKSNVKIWNELVGGAKEHCYGVVCTNCANLFVNAMTQKFGVTIVMEIPPVKHVSADLMKLVQTPIVFWEFRSPTLDVDQSLKNWRNPQKDFASTPILHAFTRESIGKTIVVLESAKSDFSKEYPFCSILINLRNLNSHKESPKGLEQKRRLESMLRCLNWIVLGLVKQQGAALHRLYKGAKI